MHLELIACLTQKIFFYFAFMLVKLLKVCPKISSGWEHQGTSLFIKFIFLLMLKISACPNFGFAVEINVLLITQILDLFLILCSNIPQHTHLFLSIYISVTVLQRSVPYSGYSNTENVSNHYQVVFKLSNIQISQQVSNLYHTSQNHA